MKTFYWHDYETSGIHPARDRPIQFAGVRTNEQLEIIGEPLVEYCQPPLDSLPHPMACQVTGITPQYAMEQGLSEPEFIQRIHSELAAPGTCGVGYNSIRFDDEVTRYTLYRNFFDPYQREWQNGNSRWDIIDMVRMTRALRPEGINWPDYDDGSANFRLEYLTAANGIGHESAHDALSDVLATIELTRLIRLKQPRLYEYVLEHKSKQQVSRLVNLFNPKPFLHVSSRLPRDNGYVGVMLPLAIHPTNNNAVICFNLVGDAEALVNQDAEQLRELLFTPTEQLGEGQPRLMLKAVHLNRCPIVATVKLLDSQSAKRLNIDISTCESRWQVLRDLDLGDKVRKIFAEPFANSVNDPEQQLYDGFPDNADKSLFEQIRVMSSDELASNPPRFQDKRYRELLFLYRARNYPETLSAVEKEQWLSHRKQRILQGSDGYLSLEEFQIQLAALESPQPQLVESLRAWADYLTRDFTESVN